MENNGKMTIPEDVADLIAAKPDQGMNRSADQVRLACRPYVDAGRIPPEGLESIVRLFNLGKSRGYSFDQTGALVDYSGATMSRLFGGKYEGALDKVVRQVDAFLELESERDKMRSDRFIENSVWHRVRNLCDFAIMRNTVVRLTGPTQMGKSKSFKEYMRRSQRQVCYVRIPAAPTLKLCVAAVAGAVGVNPSLRYEDARMRVAHAVSRNTLLIVDELHELAMSAGKGTAMKVKLDRPVVIFWKRLGYGMPMYVAVSTAATPREYAMGKRRNTMSRKLPKRIRVERFSPLIAPAPPCQRWAGRIPRCAGTPAPARI